MNIVLMAGGGGTRLWPISRERTPKQFIDLGAGETLIAKAFNRAVAITDRANIFVATRRDYQDQIKQFLPDLPAGHLILEPEKRDTTAAFVNTCLWLSERQLGNQPTIFMWSDHVFSAEDNFITDLTKIPALLGDQPDHLVLVGHRPISPDTALGYFETGELIPPYPNVFRIKRFVEKPSLSVAEKLISTGHHFWNLGYFSVLPRYLLSELIRLNPDLAPAVKTLERAIQSQSDQDFIAAYHQFPKISLEYTLIEKTPRLLAVTGDYGWSDIGNWYSFKRIFGTAGDHMPQGHHVHVNSDNNYIYNTTSKCVSLIGLKDTIVVVTDDAILVTNQDHAPQVKDVVAHLEAADQRHVL